VLSFAFLSFPQLHVVRHRLLIQREIRIGDKKALRVAAVVVFAHGFRTVEKPDRFTPTRDTRNIACLWDPEAKELLYRAPDCKEGRNFLAAMGKIAGKTPEQMARIFEKWCAKETSATT
jgi:hypothetical protein